MKSVALERRQQDRALLHTHDLLRALQRNHDLLRALSKAQSQFIADACPHDLFGTLLTNLLSLTQSKYGFISEVLHKTNGDTYLKTHAITTRSDKTQVLCEARRPNPPDAMSSHVNTLLSEVIRTGQPAIVNKGNVKNGVVNIRRDRRAEEHPPLNTFLALPIHQNDKLIGVIGIANRPHGYDMKTASYLMPFLTTCGHLITGYQNEQRRKEAEQALEERLKFETLLADLSGKFVNLPARKVDKNIKNGLKRIVEYLSLDRCSLLEFSDDKTQLHLTQSYAVKNVKPAPLISISEHYPWITERLHHGEIACVLRPDDLPEEAWREKKYLADQGIKSIALIPLMAGGVVLGAIGFVSMSTERTWPDDLVQRLRFLGEILAGVLIRKKSEQELQDHIEFERLLSNISATFVNLPTGKVDTAIGSALGLVSEFLGADRGAVLEFLDGKKQRFTHYWTTEGISPKYSAGDVLTVDDLPWLTDKLLRGEAVHIPRLEDLPPEASGLRVFLKRAAVKSELDIPLVIAGTTFGVVVFIAETAERSWPQELIQRVRLIGEIFANALERKRAENAYRRSEAQFRMLAERVPALFSYVGTDFRYRFVNKRYEELTGIPAEQIVGKHIKDLIGEDAFARAHPYLEQAVAGTPVTLTNHLSNNPLGLQWVEKQYVPDFDDTDQVKGAFILTMDITQRKKTEEALRDSENQLRLVTDALPVLIGYVDAEQRYRFNNRAYEDWLDIPRVKITGQKVSDILGAPAYEAIQQYIEMALSGQRVSFETNIAYKDGGIRCVHADYIPDVQESGQVKGFFALATDITERKRNEETQRQRGKVLEKLASGEPLNEVLGCLAEAVEEANPGMLCSILLLDKQGKHLLNGAAPNLPDFYKQAIDGLAIGPEVGSCGAAAYTKERVIVGDIKTHPNWREYRTLAEKAGLRACWSQPIVGATGSVLGTFAMYYHEPRDPTTLELEFINNSAQLAGIAIERRRTEEALLESENQLRLVADSLPVLIAYFDSKEVYRFNNKAHEEWLGIPRSKIAGRHLKDVLGDPAYQNIKGHIDEVLAGRTTSFENKVSFKDGQNRHIHADLIPHFGQKGRAIGFFALIADITAHKLSEEELHKALAEVAQLKDRLQADNIYLQEEVKVNHNFEEIIGRSEELKKVLYKLEQVASTDTTVLILGETGTGKELLARAIHSLSSRKDRPLIKVNCASLPENIVESELFGHEKGAFTGAITKQIGRFELAHGATIFLDEIGELPLNLQAKLLRVLQEGEFERIGNPHSIKVDARVITATNRDLEEAVQDGSFRADLYYRLNVFPLHVPPLRKRKEDIPLLVRTLIRKFGKRIGKVIDTVPQRVLDSFQKYPWPGNVRELENVIERAVILSPGSTLRMEDRLEVSPATGASGRSGKTLEEIERDHILEVLENTDWKIEGKNGSAEILGLNAGTLRSRMRKLRIRRP